MNILYFNTHDMGRYNGIYGQNEYTPHMKEFSKDACTFRHAYSAAPTCSPSRGAMLTGMLPHSNGLIGLTHRGFSMNDPKKHLSHFLRERGYHTVLCGVQHESDDVSELGYDEIYIKNLAPGKDTYAAEKACEYIESAKEPFFMAVGMLRPHRAYKKHSDIDPDRLALPYCIVDNQRNREDYADYLTTLREADKCFGDVINALKENGLYESTVIILTTDHGIAFPFMKNTLFDSGTGVTLAIRVPKLTHPKASDALISQIDIFPTICDLINTPKPEYLQGRSLLPIFKDEADEINEEIFSEMNYHVVYEAARSVRTKRYKYIRRYGESNRTLTINIDEGICHSFLVENGLSMLKTPEHALYDLYMDPAERNNLANDSEYAEVLCDMKRRLENNMKKTDDPLLEGCICHPSGARLGKG